MILFGTDSLNGLQTSRILWRRGVPVIGIAKNPASPYCRTRAAAQTINTETFRANPHATMEALKKQYHAERLVAMACSDENVWWMNDNRELIAEHADFLLPPSDTLQLLANKTQFYHYAIEHNLPLSDTRFASSVEDLEKAAQEMNFPLILKPPRRSPEWMAASGGFKVLKVNHPGDLTGIAQPLLKAVDELILQTWIKGSDANMHSLYICLDRQSEPIGCLVAKKIRQWPPDIGVGCMAVQVSIPEVVEAGMAVLQKLGYVGPGSLQFKQDEETKKFYMIEMNAGRPPLNYPLCEACGMEITYSGYCAAGGLPLPKARTITCPGAKWICWKTDLASAYAHWKRGDLTISEWLSSIRGHKWSADIQLDDPMPTLADWSQKIRTGFSNSAQKTLND